MFAHVARPTGLRKVRRQRTRRGSLGVKWSQVHILSARRRKPALTSVRAGSVVLGTWRSFRWCPGVSIDGTVELRFAASVKPNASSCQPVVPPRSRPRQPSGECELPESPDAWRVMA